MTDLRMKIISIACALALVAGCMPAVAFAQEESEDAPSPAPIRIPIDKQAFAQAEEEGITLQSVNLNATVAPHDAFSDEFLYFTKYESGNRLTSGEGYDMLLSAGDNYHAMGCYQFDNRYGLQDFLVACYNYSPTRYSMFAWLKDASVDISNMKLYDSSKKALTDTGKRLNNSWSAAYQANPEEFSRLQDGWFYQEYVEYALRLCNNSAHNFNMDSRSDCIKGLVSGICNLFGSGGMQFFVGGTLYGKHYDGAGLSGTMSDREFVTTLCNYIVDHVAEMPYINSQYVSSYQNRYKNELAECLAYIGDDPEPTPTPDPDPDPTPEPNKSFSDLEDNAWYLEAVDYVSTRNIIKGYDDGRFDPNGELTRGQLITMLWRIQNEPHASTSTKAFKDVDYKAFYGNAIRWARATGVASGYGDNTFMPDAPIKREEIAIMLANYAQIADGKVPNSDGVKLKNFPDASSVDTWAYNAMSWAVDKELISGKIDADGTAWLTPTTKATRAEAAAILMRYLENR